MCDHVPRVDGVLMQPAAILSRQILHRGTSSANYHVTLHIKSHQTGSVASMTLQTGASSAKMVVIPHQPESVASMICKPGLFAADRQILHRWHVISFYGCKGTSDRISGWHNLQTWFCLQPMINKATRRDCARPSTVREATLCGCRGGQVWVNCKCE